MARSELMVMLTWHDKTVQDALEIFESCKDIDVKEWGFKNVGICEYDTVHLIRNMKEAGKKTNYEIITREKEAYRYGEVTAQRAKFHCLMGSKYDKSLHEVLKREGIEFMPAVGNPGCFYNGEHGVLLGEEDEIVREADELINKVGVQGITIPVFRYYKDSEKLLRELLKVIPGSLITVAGSVDTFDKIDMMNELGIARFTMGSALFNKKYVPDGTFRDNLKVVADYINNKYPANIGCKVGI